jgi:hypothetical protein
VSRAASLVKLLALARGHVRPQDTARARLPQEKGETYVHVFDRPSAQELFGETTITGTLNSTPSTKLGKRTFTTQLFSSPAADPSGFGEG